MDQSVGTVMRAFGPSQQLAATVHRAVGYATAQLHRALTLEHLLLSLTEDPDAAAVLKVSNVDLQKLKTDVGGYLGALDDRMPPNTPNYEPAAHDDLIRIFKVAAAAARQRNRAPTGGLILAAIIGDGQSPAANMLKVQGLTFDEAVKALQSAASAAPPTPQQQPQVAPAPPQQQSRPQRAATAAPPPPAPPRQAPPAQQPPGRVAAANGAAAASAAQAIAQQASPAPVHIAPVPSPPPPPATAPPAPAPPTAPSQQAAPAPGATHSILAEARERVEASRANGRLPIGEQADPRPDPQARQQSTAGQPAMRPQAGPAAATRVAQHDPRMVAQQNAARTGELSALRREGSPNPPPQAAPAIPTARPGMHPHRQLPPNRIEQPQHLVPPAQPTHPGERTEPQFAQTPAPQPAPQQQRAPSPGVPAPGSPGAIVPGAQHQPPPTQRPQPAPQPQAKAPGRAAPGVPLEQAQFARDGELTRDIPQRMRQGVSELIEVRIPRHDIERVEAAPPADPRTGRRDYTVAKAMTLRLRSGDGSFYIENDAPETQWIENRLGLLTDDYVIWRWAITPRDAGTHAIQLSVSLRSVTSDGAATETALPDERIDVRVSRDRSQVLPRIAGWIIAMALGGAAVLFGADALTWASRYVVSLLG
ncbi:MAG: Clp protease N-terminal domain-containing protein [Pseudomonadota bacterium]